MRTTLVFSLIGFAFFNATANDKNLKQMGTQITGDFNGDRIDETAKLVKLHDNTLELPDFNETWEIQFSNKKLSSLQIEAHEPQLIKEGDLLKKGRTLFSVVSQPPTGCSLDYWVYGLLDDKWSRLASEIVPGGCSLSNQKISKLISVEGTSVYFYADPKSGNSGKKGGRKLLKLN